MREVKQKDEVAALIRSFNNMVAIQRNLLRDISDTVNVLSASYTQISASTSQLAASSSETATAVSETTATIEEVGQTTALTNMKAKQVAESSQRAVHVSMAGKAPPMPRSRE